MLEKILEYQNLETEILNLENKLSKSEAREKASKIQQKLKGQRENLISLEENAKRVNNAYNVAVQKYTEYLKKLEELEKELETADGAKLALYEKAYKDFSSIASSLERDIAAIHTEVQKISRDYETTIKQSKIDREQFDKFRDIYNKEKTDLEPKIENLKKDLSKKEKGIDESLFSIYKQKRENNLFPIFVLLNVNKCGGCRMEISASKLGQMKTNKFGTVECENCGRLNYTK
ncbi:MAG: hypothetical protein IJ538_05165 [Clostridia bacterium]|nr:hypothetical protein [Clostridia bacterium]